MKQSLLAAAVLTAMALPAADAALFDFSYTTAGGVLAGKLDGVLQVDGNTVVVSSFLDFVTFGGTPGPSLGFVESFDERAGLGFGLDPVLTLDGSFMDLIACDNLLCSARFAFAVDNDVATTVGVDFFNFGPGFGDDQGLFVPSRWSLTEATGAPVPATLPLLILGALGLGLARRRAN